MDGVSQISAETTQLEQTEISTHAAPTAPNRLQFWEAQNPRPNFEQGGEKNSDLINVANSFLGKCMAHPYLPVEEIRAQQFARVKELVEMAYRELPVYRAKYKKAGFKPSHLKAYEDIQKIPVVTKPELVAAFPDQCVNRKYKSESLFPTRSSGSSGQTLLIRVDYD